MSTETYEVDRARDFFTNVRAYAPFTLFSGKVMSRCMDPRGKILSADIEMVKIEGPGGDLGSATDLAIAESATTGKSASISQAVRTNVNLIRPSIPSAHPGCLYAAEHLTLTTEQADPSPATENLVDSWLERKEWGFLITQGVRDEAKGGATLVADRRREEGKASVQHFAEDINQSHPDHDNVNPMEGIASPGFYLVNLTQRLGLNRQLKHVHEGIQVKAYHDNVVARFMEMFNVHPLDAQKRLVAMGALLYRSAAALTVIDAMKRADGTPLELWQVTDGKKGPEFEQFSIT